MNTLSKSSKSKNPSTTLFPIIAFLPILLVSLTLSGNHLPILLGIAILLGMLIVPFMNIKTR